MQQIKLISKLGLMLITITAISVAWAIQASYYYYYIQAADAQLPPEAYILPENSVFSQTIVDDQVKTQDLANDSVTTAKIRNGEVNTEDLASGAVVPNVHIVIDWTTIVPFSAGGAVASCPSGEKVIGGGFRAQREVRVEESRPTSVQQGWLAGVYNPGSVEEAFGAYAVCMGPSPP